MSDESTSVNDPRPEEPREFGFYFPLSLVMDMNRIGTRSRGMLFTAIAAYYFTGEMPSPDELPKEAYGVFSTYLPRLRKARAQNRQKDAKTYEELQRRERQKALDYERRLAEWERLHEEGETQTGTQTGT